MTSAENWAIPKGSTVLVTGVSGFVGSHIADQFLHHGFRVRGTVRDQEKYVWLSNLFNEKYGPGSFEFCQISDMAVPNAFDMAIKGNYLNFLVRVEDNNFVFLPIKFNLI